MKKLSIIKKDVKIRLLPNSKTSQGHVEMILATTLFIGFLIFIFIFLRNPLKAKEIPIDDVQKKVIKNISGNIGKLSVVVESNDDCYDLDKVKDDYGSNFIEIIEQPRKYTIYFGDFFDPGLIGKISCSDKKDRKFKLGVYTVEKIIVKSKLQKLKTAYQDYAILKESLKINDFAFQVKNLNNEIISELSAEPFIPENVNIASKDIPVRIMDERGNVQELILNIKTWR